MSQSSDRYVLGVSDLAQAVRDGARGTAQLDSGPSVLRLGVVTAVSGDYYSVALVLANGATGDVIPGVRLWGSGTLSVGDRVTLGYFGKRPIPWIIGGVGGGGGDAVYRTAVTGFLGFVGE